MRNLLAGRSTIGFHHKITLDLGSFGPVFIHAHVVEGKILISHRNIVRIVQLLGNSEITQIRSIDIVHGESLNLISRNLHRLRSDTRRTSCILNIRRRSTLGNATHIPNRNLRRRHLTSTINSQRKLHRRRLIGIIGLRHLLTRLRWRTLRTIRHTTILKDIPLLLIRRNHLMRILNSLNNLELTHWVFSRNELIGHPKVLALIGDSVVKDIGGFGAGWKHIPMVVFANMIVPSVANSLHVFFNKTTLRAHRDVADGLRWSAIALNFHFTVVVFVPSSTGVVNREFGEPFLQLSDFCVFTLCDVRAIFRHDRDGLVKEKTTSWWGKGVSQGHTDVAVFDRGESY